MFGDHAIIPPVGQLRPAEEKHTIDSTLLPRSVFQAMTLTLAFVIGLCLLGPVGAEREDPLSRWLLTHSPSTGESSRSWPGNDVATAVVGSAPFSYTLMEWTGSLLAGICAVLAMAYLSKPLALAFSAALALFMLLLPMLIFPATGLLVSSSIPVISIAFGLLCTALLADSSEMRQDLAQSSPPVVAEQHSSAEVSLSNDARRPESDAPRAENRSIQSTRTIGRYEIIRSIGKGAMGEVFLGRDPNINRLTAIKTLHFEEAFAPEDIEPIKSKFFREAESAGTLSHPHIVTIYDAGEDGSSAYIAMEFIEGTTLLRFVRRKHLLPLRRLIRYMVQVAEALDYAHTQGVVHRDIKPANIILTPTGQIKITDFGIAHIATSSHTQTGVVKGTPYYMSPEQFSGQKVDGRSDIFSLGTTMFQLLTGTLPFYAESPALLMNQIMNFPHPNPRAINPRIVPAMVGIVDKALHKDRNDRYQTADALAAALRRLDKRIVTALRKGRRSNDPQRSRRETLPAKRDL